MKKFLFSLSLILKIAFIFGTISCTIPKERKINLSENLYMKVLSGPDAREYFEDIAQIRISLFSEYPYLYEGTIEHEKEYLETYFKSSCALILLVFDGQKIVGFSNSIALSEESEEMKTPFIEHKLNLSEYLYIGEVMIYKPYRNKKILRKFLEFHENTALTQGYSHMIFMTVERPDNHPARPDNHRLLDPVWKHFGYQQIPGLQIHFMWPQVDTNQDTENTLAIWQKNIQ